MLKIVRQLRRELSGVDKSANVPADKSAEVVDSASMAAPKTAPPSWKTMADRLVQKLDGADAQHADLHMPASPAAPGQPRNRS